MTVIALQNLVAYSVNMLDNIMLGSYSQNALSGAATVNQIYFIVNQIALAIGNALIAISSQYWGSHQTKPIRKVTKIFDVSEPNFRLVHRNAIVLSGRILLETSGRTCGDCCSIRSDFQMPAHIPALQKLQMDPQADGNRLMQ